MKKIIAIAFFSVLYYPQALAGDNHNRDIQLSWAYQQCVNHSNPNKMTLEWPNSPKWEVACEKISKQWDKNYQEEIAAKKAAREAIEEEVLKSVESIAEKLK